MIEQNDPAFVATEPEATNGAIPLVNATLTVKGLTVLRQGLAVTHGVDVTLKAHQIVALLGANGAGKSSLLDGMMGIAKVSHGRIAVDGRDLTVAPPERRAEVLGYVPEGRRLLPLQSVEENLAIPAYGLPSRVLRSRLLNVYEIFPHLHPIRRRSAGQLSGGEQQMVALGRALMGGAPFLLIDEMSLGLSPKLVAVFAEALKSLRDAGYGVLLVEQYLSLALNMADFALVLNRGRVVMSGPSEDLRHEVGRIEAAYLDTAKRHDGSETIVDQFDLVSEVGEHSTAGYSQDYVAHDQLAVRHRGIGASNGLIGVGTILIALSAALPWFSFQEAFSSGNLTGWHFWLQWLLVAAALGAIASTLARSSRIARLSTAGAIVLSVVAIALLMTWVWLSGWSLPSEESRSYTRSWGMLVALHGIVFLIAGLVMRYMQEARHYRAPATSQMASTTGGR